MKRMTAFGEVEDPPKLTRVEEIQQRLDKATPAPWGPYSANIPFYVEVTKPAPSMSKHDSTRPTYWKYDDGIFVACAYQDIKYLLERIKELEKKS